MTEFSAYQKGLRGEAQACEYLCQRGMVPLFKRYHSPFGEIDLIMRDGETLVFVEVKARTRGRAYEGANAVGYEKQRRMIQTARQYLSEHPDACPIRFDVVELTKDGIQHLSNAFEGKEW